MEVNNNTCANCKFWHRNERSPKSYGRCVMPPMEDGTVLVVRSACGMKTNSVFSCNQFSLRGNAISVNSNRESNEGNNEERNTNDQYNALNKKVRKMEQELQIAIVLGGKQ